MGNLFQHLMHLCALHKPHRHNEVPKQVWQFIEAKEAVQFEPPLLLLKLLPSYKESISTIFKNFSLMSILCLIAFSNGV